MSGKSKLRMYRVITRTLSPSQVQRGYIYIGIDNNMEEILDIGNFNVEFNGQTFPSRRLDSYGRIQIPRRVIKTIDAGQKLRISLVSRRKVKVDIIA